MIVIADTSPINYLILIGEVGVLPAPFGHAMRSGGVIWNPIPFEIPVIPAQAGIQSVAVAFPMWLAE